MKVTVITVSRNSAATLPDTLRSVAEQSLPGVEHIVVDGASTDATADVVRRHGTHVAKFLSEPDHGIYDAMNKGLRLATGDIVAFLNADDRYADAGVLERVARAMDKEGLDAIFGDVAFFRAQNPQSIVRRYRSDRFHPSRLAWGWMPAHPALFMRREIFRRIGLFRTDYRIAGDFELVARAFKDGNLRYRHLPEVLVMMRTGGVSTGGWRNTLILNREVLRACRENGIPTNLIKILSKYPAKLLEFGRP
jgi:glycosyltransferase involved in cell wall biosynthesis